MASRTAPAASAVLFLVEPLPAAFLLVTFLPVTFLLVTFLGAELRELVERFLDADVRLAADDRFLDAPQVDMTSYTVPIGCHTQP